MPFNPNLPNAGDKLSKSQGDLKSNNQGLDASFGANHIPFSNNTAESGKHKYCQFPVQGSAPTTNTTEAAVYVANDGASVPQFFYVPASNGTPYQINSDGKWTAGTPASNGTFVAGIFRVNFGNVTVTAGTPTAITYKTAFTGAPAYTLQFLSDSASGNISINYTNSLATGVTVTCNRASRVNYLTIGPV